MKHFSKQELIARVAELNDIESTAAARRVVNHIIATITDQLSEGNEVALSGLCNFKLIDKPAKSGEIAGVPYKSPAKRVVRIKPTAPLKRKVA